MKILHIAKINNNKTLGVDVVVPKHIEYQGAFNDVYFYNLSNCDIKLTNATNLSKKYPIDSNLIANITTDIGKIDIVVFHEVNNIENIKIYPQLLKLNIPYIIVPHGEISANALKKKWLKKKIAYFLLFNRFINKASAIQCLSNREKEDILISTPNKFVVGNGVEMPTNTKKDFSTIGVKIIYVGRLDIYHKGLDLMIEAVANIAEFLLNNKVTINLYGPDILGRGDQVNALIKKYNIGSLVTLNPPVFDNEKEKLYLQSDIFIQTSRFEGLPVGLLEAISYGLPCIVTKGTNTTNMIDKYKAGYNAGLNVEDISNAIIHAIKDKNNWKEKGQNAILAIKENFMWENIAKLEVEQYRSILSN